MAIIVEKRGISIDESDKPPSKRSIKDWVQRFVPLDISVSSERVRRGLRLFWVDGLLIGSVGAIQSFVSLYALAFGATNAQIGLMSTLVNIAGGIAMLPGAKLTRESVGLKRMVLFFSRGIPHTILILLVLLPFFFSGEAGVWGLIALWVVRGFFASAASPAWSTLAGRIVPIEVRGNYFAARNIAKKVARLLIIPAIGWLIDYIGFPAGYQVGFAIAAVIGAFEVWAYARIPVSDESEDVERADEQEDPAELNETAEKPREALDDPDEDPDPEGYDNVVQRNFWLFCLTSAIWTFSVQFAGPFFNVYLVRQLGATEGVVGTLQSVKSLASVPGQVLFGRWLDDRGSKWTLRLSGFLIPFLAWGWIFVPGPWWTLPIFAGSGFLWSGYGLGRFNLMLQTTSKIAQTRQIAVYKTIMKVAAAAAPFLGGIFVERVGFLALFALSGLGRLLSVILVSRFVRDMPA